MAAQQNLGTVPAHDDALFEAQPLRGPAFSTYRADDVGWLLTDLDGVPDASAAADERSRYYRDGMVAELAPASYQPSAEYDRLLAAAIDRHAQQIATAVGVLTETTLERLGGSAVVVSIMRAGVPVGVLMHRWARRIRSMDLPHYAISIVQEAGVDPQGLRWLAHEHNAQNVVFVDGWTGKGTVALTFKHSVVDAVETRFEDAALALARGRPAMAAPNWSGRRAAERLVEQYGVDHIDLVKPGVCESTRVLVQWHVNRIVIRRSAAADLDHVLLLAEERDVAVDYADDLPFSCVALVPPRPILANATPTRPYR